MDKKPSFYLRRHTTESVVLLLVGTVTTFF